MNLERSIIIQHCMYVFLMYFVYKQKSVKWFYELILVFKKKNNTILGISIDLMDFVSYVMYIFCFGEFIFNHSKIHKLNFK